MLKNKLTEIWLEEYVVPYQFFIQEGLTVETASVEDGTGAY